jgi:hypothetical protein
MNSAQEKNIGVIDRCGVSKDFSPLHLSQLPTGTGLVHSSLPPKTSVSGESHNYFSVTAKQR